MSLYAVALLTGVSAIAPTENDPRTGLAADVLVEDSGLVEIAEGMDRHLFVKIGLHTTLDAEPPAAMGWAAASSRHARLDTVFPGAKVGSLAVMDVEMRMLNANWEPLSPVQADEPIAPDIRLPSSINLPGAGTAALTIYLITNQQIDTDWHPPYDPENLRIAEMPLTAQDLRRLDPDASEAELGVRLRLQHRYKLLVPWQFRASAPDAIRSYFPVTFRFREPLSAGDGLSRIEWKQSIALGIVGLDGERSGYNTRTFAMQTSVAFDSEFDAVTSLASRGVKTSSTGYGSELFSPLSEVSAYATGDEPLADLTLRATSSRRKDMSDFLVFGLAALFGAAAASLFELSMSACKRGGVPADD